MKNIDHLLSLVAFLFLANITLAQTNLPTLSPLLINDQYITDDGRLLMGVGGSDVGNFTDGAIFSAVDDESWEIFAHDFDGYPVQSISENEDGDLFAGTDGGGVYRILNGGPAWMQQNSGLTNLEIRDICTDIPTRTCLVTENEGVFVSDNNGDTWTISNTGLTSLQTNFIDSDDAGNLYVGADFDPNTFVYGLYRSIDQGDTWSQVIFGEAVKSYVLNPNNGHMFVSSNSAFLVSTDGGQTWNYSASGGGFVALEMDNAGNLYGGTAGGGGAVYRSKDGGNTWVLLDLGFIADVTSITYHDNSTPSTDDDFLIVGTTEGCLWVDDPDQSPTVFEYNLGLSLDNHTQIEYVEGSPDLYITGTPRGCFYLELGGDTWFPLIYPGFSSLINITSIHLFENNNLLVTGEETIGGDQGAYLFDMDVPNNPGIEAGNGLTDNPVRELKEGFTSGDVYAVQENGDIFNSDDFGENFYSFATGLPASGARTTQAVLSGNKVYIGTEEGLYVSDFPNNNFSPVSGWPSGCPVNSLIAPDPDDLGLVAGTNGCGIMVSFDGGSEWFSASNGLPEGSNVIDVQWLFGDDDTEIFCIVEDMGLYVIISGNWEIVDVPGIDPKNINEISGRINDEGEKIYILATDYGVFETKDLQNFTGIGAALTIFLEGPFNGTSLDTKLEEQDLIPSTQPFNSPPWNYDGEEEFSVQATADVVDWIYLQVRETAGDASTADETTIKEEKAALLLNNGEIIESDGTFPMQFEYSPTENVYFVVYPRNHLPVMTATFVTQADGVYSWNFSISEDQAYGTGTLTELSGGIFGCFSGDFNQDGQITNEDLEMWKANAGINAYSKEDANLDGETDNKDKNDLVQKNLGAQSAIP